MALSDHSVTPVRNTSVRQACTVVGGVENLALLHPIVLLTGLPWWLSGKESACQCRKPGFDLWVWKITVGKEMATHSSILAWKISWTEEPEGLQSMGLQKSQTLLINYTATTEVFLIKG